MIHTAVFILVILIGIKAVLDNSALNTRECMTDKEIKTRARELYKNKNVFKAGVKYGTVKNKMPWIDPVIYDDVYKESLQADLNISNLEKIFI